MLEIKSSHLHRPRYRRPETIRCRDIISFKLIHIYCICCLLFVACCHFNFQYITSKWRIEQFSLNRKRAMDKQMNKSRVVSSKYKRSLPFVFVLCRRCSAKCNVIHHQIMIVLQNEWINSFLGTFQWECHLNQHDIEDWSGDAFPE